MKTQPLAWHSRNLENLIFSHKRKMESIARQQADADRLKREIIVLVGQIERAKREKREGFDSERYNISKNPNVKNNND